MINTVARTTKDYNLQSKLYNPLTEFLLCPVVTAEGSSSCSGSSSSPPLQRTARSQPSWMELAKRKSLAWNDKSLDWQHVSTLTKQLCDCVYSYIFVALLFQWSSYHTFWTGLTPHSISVHTRINNAFLNHWRLLRSQHTCNISSFYWHKNMSQRTLT